MHASDERGFWSTLAAALLLAGLAGCAHAPFVPRVREDAGSRAQLGEASYYADHFEGRTTASGGRYRGAELTAAHRTLAFGTRVRVTHLGSGRTVDVTINDRGPHRRGRIIDLSRRAARDLGMLAEGVARVRVDVIAWP